MLELCSFYSKAPEMMLFDSPAGLRAQEKEL